MSNNSDKKSKLTLNDFKIKSSLTGSKEALDAITGGILGACHDTTGSGGVRCTNNYDTGR